MPQNPSPIDAVITWVDGDDPAHKAKLQAYLKTLGRDIPGSAAPTRFRERGELEYCVASILRFAPWFRTIHIVTDNQTPPFLRGEIDQALADKINLVNHNTVFRGHEDVLPVFSCRPIETVLWRIPNLADRFIYFNDDMMLTRPVAPTDFFQDDKLVLRGHWTRHTHQQWLFRLKRSRPVRALRPTPLKPNRANHLRMQELSARAMGYNDRYFNIPHEPHPAFRDQMKALFEAHPDWLRDNIRHKLRHPDQIWSFSLAAHQAIHDNRALLTRHPKLALIKAENHTVPGIRWALHRLNLSRRTAFLCIQSLDQAKPDVQEQIIQWLEERIGGLPSVGHSNRSAGSVNSITFP